MSYQSHNIKEVQAYDNFTILSAQPGKENKIYIDKATNIPYRWDSATNSYIAIGSQGGSTVTIQSSSTTKPTNPKEGDELIIESGGVITEQWLYDGSAWIQRPSDKVLDVLQSIEPTPNLSGTNTTNLGKIFKDASGSTFIVDFNGDAIQLSSPIFKELNQFHVDKNGNDTTGTGADEAPFLTIAKALSVASLADAIIVNEGVYTETVTLATQNQTIRGEGDEYGGLTEINALNATANGTSVRASQLTVTGNVTHSGTSPLYLSGMTVSGNYTSSSTAYSEIKGSRIQDGTISKTAAGILFITDSLIGNATFSTANSVISMRNVTIDAGDCVSIGPNVIYSMQDVVGCVNIDPAAIPLETAILAQGGTAEQAKSAQTSSFNMLKMLDPDTNNSNTNVVSWNTTTKRLEVSNIPTGGGSWTSGTNTPADTGNTTTSLGVTSLPVFYYNTDTGNRYYVDGAGASFLIEKGYITSSVTPVYYNGTSWVSASNTSDTTVAKAMRLSDGSIVNNVTVEYPSHGLDIGEIYYLDSVSGGYTKTPPSSPNYTQQLFIVKDANTIHIDIEQAYVASATDSVTFGTTDPTSPSATANEGDIYFKTSDGTANGTVISTFVYDKTSGKWITASASSTITTTSLAPKTGNGTAYVNPTLVSDNTLVDVIELSDGSKLHTGQVTWTNHGLPIHTYFYASATAPFYTATEPTTGYSQQLFYTIDANHIAIDIEQGTLLSGSSSNPTYMVTAYSTINDPLPGAYTIQVNKYNVVDLANTLGGAETAFNTSTYRFTPTKAGWYDVTVGYDIFRGSTTEGYVILRKNGAIIASVGGFGAVKQNVSKVVYMNGTTDYLDGANQGGAAVTRQQNAVNSFIQAKWLHT